MTVYPHPRWIEQVLLAEARVGDVRLVCVDGPSGAGKTTTAEALAAALAPSVGAVPVVHADDLYEGWPVVAGAADRLQAFALLGERVGTWLLQRWVHGLDGEHPRWDWHLGAWHGTVLVPPAPVVVLEGVGLGQRVLREQAALTVWVDADPDERLARVVARDGEQVRDELEAWRHDEALWHLLDGTADAADVRTRT